MKILELKNISKSFGAIHALENIDLDITQGEALGATAGEGCRGGRCGGGPGFVFVDFFALNLDCSCILSDVSRSCRRF